MELSNEIMDKLSDEMREKVAECETPADLIELATEEGIELTEEQLKMVAGGEWDWDCFY